MTRTFDEFIRERFQTLRAGGHSPDGEACALEAYSQWLELTWSDDPETLGIWDIRPINDIGVTGAVRTEWMGRVITAYNHCRDWPQARQQAVVERIAIETVRQLISGLPDLTEAQSEACRRANSLAEAEAAAEAVWAAMARAAAWAAAEAAWAAAAAAMAEAAMARAAAWAAAAAARAATEAAAAMAAAEEDIFICTCRLWIEAATETFT